MPTLAMIAQSCRDKGFDKSHVSDESVSVRCSQCEAAVINGTPCHEQGCPNA